MSKIAIFSDSHDNIPALMKALEAARSSGAETLLHCGDLCAPFMLDRIGQGFSGPVHVVFGNNDGDGRLLQTIASKYAHVKLYGIYSELTIAERRVAMIHYPEPALRIAQSGEFDLVCYGHNHDKFAQQIGKTWLVNPGELLGMKSTPTWGIYDCATHNFEHVTVAG